MPENSMNCGARNCGREWGRLHGLGKEYGPAFIVVVGVENTGEAEGPSNR